ncbi:MAG: SulP family inorganic anion transporter [Gammaproteobacteria bacterium]
MNSFKIPNLRWNRVFPFLGWWPLLGRETLRADFFAGITGAVIVLPQGVAFALIAGLPPQYGLYTAIVTPIVAGLFGSSHHLISGPTTAISIVVLATVKPFAVPGSPEFISMVLTLTFLAGAFQLALGLARMGQLVNFISHSVVIGFTAGAAILIATSQLKHYIGVTLSHGQSFVHTWINLYGQLPDLNVYAAVTASVTLLAAILFRRYRPRWPGMLFAMVIGSLLSLFIGGEQHGVNLVGSLPARLPPLSLPDFSLDTIRTLGPGAMAVALLGLIEAVSIARAIAARSEQRINGDQEFIGQGLSNLVGSFFSSYAGSGSFTRSGINFQAGARTPMAAIFAALMLAVVLLVVAPLTAYLPMPAMAGIILLVAYNLIDFHHIRQTLRASRSDASVLVTTFMATLFMELEFAIYIGVILSLVLYLNRTSKPRIYTVAPDQADRLRRMTVKTAGLMECPQLRIIRIDGSLFFGAVNHVAGTFHLFQQRDPDRKHLLIVASGINFIDIAGAEMLIQEARRRRKNGGGLYLVKVKEGLYESMRKGGYLEEFGSGNVFQSKGEAITAIFEKLDRERCRHCAQRIFSECAAVEYVGLPQELAR